MNAEWIQVLKQLQNDKDYQKAVKSTISEKFEKLKKKGKKFTKCIVTNIDIICNINDNEKIILKNQVKTDFEFVSDSTGVFKTQFIE